MIENHIKMSKNTEQRIMELLIKSPLKEYSIREISKLVNVDYSLVYKSVKNLLKKEIIKTKKIGKSTSCQLNMSADPHELAIYSLIQSKKFLRKSKFGFIIKEIMQKLSDYLHILILFGSYAKGTADKNSDIDLLLVVQKEEDVDKLKNKMNSIIKETNFNIEFNVITTDWLIKMFDEKNTLGREVLKCSIVFHGADQYYSMVNIHDKKRGY